MAKRRRAAALRKKRDARNKKQGGSKRRLRIVLHEWQSGVEPPHSEKSLAEGIVAGGEEMEEAEVAEDLELLAEPPRRASFGAAKAVTSKAKALAHKRRK